MPHTEGPWTWTEGWGSDDIYTGVLGPDRQMVITPLEGDGDPAFQCKPEDMRLIAQAPEMYALLKEIEWSGHEVDMTIVDFCPSCGFARPLGHSPQCKLADVRKAVEGNA